MRRDEQLDEMEARIAFLQALNAEMLEAIRTYAAYFEGVGLLESAKCCREIIAKAEGR
jgi:hypothetical protein